MAPLLEFPEHVLAALLRQTKQVWSLPAPGNNSQTHVKVGRPEGHMRETWYLSCWSGFGMSPIAVESGRLALPLLGGAKLRSVAVCRDNDSKMPILWRCSVCQGTCRAAKSTNAATPAQATRMLLCKSAFANHRTALKVIRTKLSQERIVLCWAQPPRDMLSASAGLARIGFFLFLQASYVL